MDLELTDRNVVVTGASRGIGRACARTFAAEGARLVLAARGAEELDALAAELRDAHGTDVTTVACDLTDSDDRAGLVEAAGDVDVWVNNAGAVPSGTLATLDEESFRAGWELKLFGYVDLMRRVLPAMEERRAGVVVNVIGAAGVRPDPGYIAGAGSNAALMNMTRALGSRSLRNGVRVVAVNPGLIRTERLETLMRSTAERRGIDPGQWETLLPSDPAPGTPREIADVVAFLASSRASYVTGTTLTADGGSSAR
ncbi:MAG: short-chain dehydrogenase/reductase [Actinomycetota bacterium]|nr:short-chain dehydrogenase/reductase [Actinomycetota bacterium]